MTWLCSDCLSTDPVICLEQAFKIGSLEMYEKIAQDHIPYRSHFLLYICIQFFHGTQTAKVITYLSDFFLPFTQTYKIYLGISLLGRV